MRPGYGTANRMELRHLRYLAAVARERGFGRAASVLNLAQPALSRQIKDLEEEIGVPLLERTSKGVDPTPSGVAFLTSASRLLEEVDGAVVAVHRANVGHEGRCTLAVGRMLMATEPVSDAIMQLNDALPGVEVALEEVMAFNQMDLISSGRVDIGIAGSIPEHDLAHEDWLALDMDAALLAVDHPLATRDVLEPADLAREPVAMISPDRAPDLARAVRDALKVAGITSPQEFFYASPHTAAMVVASGRGWGPGLAGAKHRPPPGTVSIPLRGFLAQLQTNLLWRKDEGRPVVLAVLDRLRAMKEGRLPPVPAPSGRISGGRRLVPPGLELRHFRYFAAVANEGGFGRAAERLGMTQSSLSRQIGDLEVLVGATLFSRSGRGVELTDAGLALRERLPAVFDAYDHVIGVAAQARRGLAGRCVIGTIHTIAASRIIARALTRTNERWPGLEMIFEDYPTAHQPQALREGLIDLGLCHSYPSLTEDPRLMRERLVEDEINGALVAVDHPLAERESLEASELAGIPFLFIGRSFHSPFHDHILAVLANLGLKPRIEGPYDAIHMAWAVAAEGKGWTLAFDSHRVQAPTGLVAVPIHGLHVNWGLDLLWRRDEVNVAVGRVLNLMREAREILADGKPAPTVAQAGSLMRRRMRQPA